MAKPRIKARIRKLVNQIGTWVDEEEDDEALKLIEMYLNDALNLMKDEDMFGTEGQNDPRGDQRDG